MSGLNILGGIGQGLMAGSQFVQQKRTQDKTVAMNEKRLGMLEEQQGWQREEHGVKKAEQQRLLSFQNEYRSLAGEMQPGTIDFYRELSKRSFKYAKPEEIEALDSKIKSLESSELGEALLLGNTDKAGKLFSSKFGEPVEIQQVAGKDNFGNPQPVWTAVGQSGKQYFSMPAAELGALYGRKEMLDVMKERREGAKTQSEITENIAQAGAARGQAASSHAAAGKYKQEAEGQRLENEGLAALDPAARAATKSGSNLPTAVQEAMWLSGATPELQRFYERVKKITNDPDIAKAAVILQRDDPAGRFTPQTAVKAVRDTYRLAAEVQVDTPEQAAKFPPGTVFQTPDGRRLRVPDK